MNAIIKEIIDKEIQKENEEREKEIMKRKNLSEGNRFGNRNEQFGNNTSGGKWYFYNPATLSFGLSEFTKKWGKRKLEDDWRRKNKKSTKITIEDSTSAEKGGVQNTKDPQFYLSQIPVSSKDFISAREKIANACYQAAIIYKYDLQKVSKSNEMLNKILKIIDVDTSFIPLTYYNLYINFKEQNLKKQAINMKEKLLLEYPNSVFSKIILNPNYLENQQDINSVDVKEYEEVYTNLALKNHDEILMKTSSLKEGDLKGKYTFIRAISMLSKGDTTTTLNLLAEVKRGKDKNLSNYASTIIETLKDPSKLIESNREAVEKHHINLIMMLNIL